MTQAAVAQLIEDIQEEDILDTPAEFHLDVIEGLKAENKSLSPKYFYDEAGSQYFDEICELEEYYPYRTELKLLPKVALDLARRFLKPTSVVEFGAGSLIKIRPLLEHMPSICEFIPMDISGDHLFQAAESLSHDFPKVSISPKHGDFCRPVGLDRFRGERLGFFPGSTIGNFTPQQAESFLNSARLTLGSGSHMLIGVDTKKSPDVLHNAYNDQKGVTAKFNLNILKRINRELNGNIDVANFEHYAYYNPHHGRIEMHLVSTENQEIKIGSNSISINQGETIHTECSYKYTPEEFCKLAEKAGWQLEETWLADNNMFSMYLLKSK